MDMLAVTGVICMYTVYSTRRLERMLVQNCYNMNFNILTDPHVT